MHTAIQLPNKYHSEAPTAETRYTFVASLRGASICSFGKKRPISRSAVSTESFAVSMQDINTVVRSYLSRARSSTCRT